MHDPRVINRACLLYGICGASKPGTPLTLTSLDPDRGLELELALDFDLSISNDRSIDRFSKHTLCSAVQQLEKEGGN